MLKLVYEGSTSHQRDNHLSSQACFQDCLRQSAALSAWITVSNVAERCSGLPNSALRIRNYNLTACAQAPSTYLPKTHSPCPSVMAFSILLGASNNLGCSVTINHTACTSSVTKSLSRYCLNASRRPFRHRHSLRDEDNSLSRAVSVVTCAAWAE